MDLRLVLALFVAIATTAECFVRVPNIYRDRLIGSNLDTQLHALTEYDGDIMIYNTLNRKKEKFSSLVEGKVSFYSCGPTVYDYAHIGNFRAFLTYDIIKRWLQYCGYSVDHVCNLTDVDDKIIIKMMAENKSLHEITSLYTKAFFEDLEVLNIIKARAYPKATDHIEEIEQMVQKLVDTGHAYIQNGSVYFRVSSFPEYGKLANLKTDSMIQDGSGGFGPNERRGTNEKESNRDFALWKAFSEHDGDVVWEAEFGRGRPGWHIECSAMCHKLLGPTIDIHAGGVDLVFPHHQNEVAQSEAFTGQQFSRYWMHNGFVNINNEKMSKSLKNFKTLRDIVSEPGDARAFRYMVVSNQYRQPLSFTADTLKAARNSLKRIDKLVRKLKVAAGYFPSGEDEALMESSPTIVTTDTGAGVDADSGSLTTEEEKLLQVVRAGIAVFEAALCDDLNSPKAVAGLFQIVGAAEKALKTPAATAAAAATAASGKSAPPTSTSTSQSVVTRISPAVARKVLDALQRIDSVFGVMYDVPVSYFDTDADIPTTATATTTSSSSISSTSGISTSGISSSAAIGMSAPNAETNARLKELLAKESKGKVNTGGGCINCTCGASTSNSSSNDSSSDGSAVSSKSDSESMVVPQQEQLQSLARSRAEMKAQKKYAEADAIREQIKELGYGIKDVSGGGFELFLL